MIVGNKYVGNRIYKDMAVEFSDGVKETVKKYVAERLKELEQNATNP